MSTQLIEELEKERLKISKNISEFKNFKRERVLFLNGAEEFSAGADVLYWMSRECRIQDNWSLLFAQRTALKANVPLRIVYMLNPLYYKNHSPRYNHFLLDGLMEVSDECKRLNIEFSVVRETPIVQIPSMCSDGSFSCVVCDSDPINYPKEYLQSIQEKLKDIPLVVVDGHNIVPVNVASNKSEYSARTIRPKINSKLEEYLTPFPPVVQHPIECSIPRKLFCEATKCDVSKIRSMNTDDSKIKNLPPDITWAKAGYKAGIAMLEVFCKEKLQHYSTKKNDPCADASSNLSPWINFGHISVQRCVLEVSKYKKKYKNSVMDFREQVIVRRELAENFCTYNPNYKSLTVAPTWAQTTLESHSVDKRKYVYSKEQFELALTHDALWNSAQLQLYNEGKMHGYMRMYWAKKILEWTTSPAEALEIAIYLNDYHSLDGVDPNGYVGVLWSICGVHDQGFATRPIFGKIRYMNFDGCKRKFKVDEYIARWGGQEHPYPKTNEVLEPTPPKKKKKTR